MKSRLAFVLPVIAVSAALPFAYAEDQQHRGGDRKGSRTSEGPPRSFPQPASRSGREFSPPSIGRQALPPSIQSPIPVEPRRHEEPAPRVKQAPAPPPPSLPKPQIQTKPRSTPSIAESPRLSPRTASPLPGSASSRFTPPTIESLQRRQPSNPSPESLRLPPRLALPATGSPPKPLPDLPQRDAGPARAQIPAPTTSRSSDLQEALAKRRLEPGSGPLVAKPLPWPGGTPSSSPERTHRPASQPAPSPSPAPALGTGGRSPQGGSLPSMSERQAELVEALRSGRAVEWPRQTGPRPVSGSSPLKSPTPANLPPSIKSPEEASAVIRNVLGSPGQRGHREGKPPAGREVRGENFRPGDGGDRRSLPADREANVADFVRQLRGGNALAGPAGPGFRGDHRDSGRDRGDWDGDRRDGRGDHHDSGRDRGDWDRDRRDGYGDHRDFDRDRRGFHGDRCDYRGRPIPSFWHYPRPVHPRHSHCNRTFRYPSRSHVPAILLASVALSHVFLEPVPAPDIYGGGYELAYSVDPYSELSRDDILFLRGSTEFADSRSYQLVEDLAYAIMDPGLAGMSFVIEGHASAEGGYDANLELSQLRAERIAQEIVYLGIDPARLIPIGYGETEAQYPADAPEELRRLDRRVVVYRLEENAEVR